MLPTITLEAPAASAFTTSPEVLDAAVGDDGGSRARRAMAAVSMTAVSCGTPTPATTRVVQMAPGPTPTFTAWAPALISASAPSAVATFAGHHRGSRSSRA